MTVVLTVSRHRTRSQRRKSPSIPGGRFFRLPPTTLDRLMEVGFVFIVVVSMILRLMSVIVRAARRVGNRA